MRGQTILITGGTGSFGQAFARYALDHGAETVRIVSRSESKQAAMRRAFHDDPRLRFLIGDVRDLERLRLACKGVQTVIHAAALKRIEVCEYDPHEATKTNVLGTENVARACLDTGVRRGVLVSTDKACKPLTHYGITKAVAEATFLASNAYVGGPPIFAAVRYGNVANSTGSVIPLWKAQAQQGQQLTITDVRCTRYWITLEHAVRFVGEVLGHPAGKLYVPEMPSYKVVDLALACQLAFGKPENARRPFEIIGMRGVEKAHEDLVGEYERHVVAPRKPMNSGENARWLTVEDLQRKVERL